MRTTYYVLRIRYHAPRTTYYAPHTTYFVLRTAYRVICATYYVVILEASRRQGVASGRLEASRRQGVEASACSSHQWGPWGASQAKEPDVKRKAVDLAQRCIMDVPGHVRGHAGPTTKHKEMAKSPKKIRERWSGQGRCVCQSHRKYKQDPRHRSVPLAAVIRLRTALRATTPKLDFLFQCTQDKPNTLNTG